MFSTVCHLEELAWRDVVFQESSIHGRMTASYNNERYQLCLPYSYDGPDVCSVFNISDITQSITLLRTAEVKLPPNQASSEFGKLANKPVDCACDALPEKFPC